MQSMARGILRSSRRTRGRLKGPPISDRRPVLISSYGCHSRSPEIPELLFIVLISMLVTGHKSSGEDWAVSEVLHHRQIACSSQPATYRPPWGYLPRLEHCRSTSDSGSANTDQRLACKWVEGGTRTKSQQRGDYDAGDDDRRPKSYRTTRPRRQRRQSQF